MYISFSKEKDKQFERKNIYHLISKKNQSFLIDSYIKSSTFWFEQISLWWAWWDLNPHSIATIGVWDQRVYRFRHTPIIICRHFVDQHTPGIIYTERIASNKCLYIHAKWWDWQRACFVHLSRVRFWVQRVYQFRHTGKL